MKTLLFFSLLVCAVSADVSCLTIAWWSPIGGLICYLIPEQFNEAETAVAQQINTTVHQAKNAADFTLHNNPFTLGFDYLSTANSQGLNAANTQFEQKAYNISQVTLGFAKETVSQALTIVELASFGMIVDCIEFQAVQQGISAAYQAAGGQGISNTPSDGTNLATSSTYGTGTTSPPLPVITSIGSVTLLPSGLQASSPLPTSALIASSGPIGQIQNAQPIYHSYGTSRKRSLRSVTDQGGQIVQGCISQHFQKPLILKQSNNLQQQGADISDVAGLLIPVVGGEAAAANAAADTIDLAIPGVVDSTRIVKLGEDGATQGVHFASYEEATEVSQSLEGNDFDSLGCKICASPPVPSVSRFRRLLRRGQAFSMCCPLNKMASATSAELDTILESPDAVELQDLPADSGSGDLPQGVTVESAQTDSYFPDLKVLSAPIRTALTDVIGDLNLQGTAALGYSPALQGIADSKTILTDLAGFIDEPDLVTELGFKQSSARWESESGNSWLQSTDPRLATLQKWTNQVIQDLTAASDTILEADTASQSLQGSGYKWRAQANLYYVQEGVSQAASNNAAQILNYHVDEAYLSFSTSNVNGLTVLIDGRPRIPVLAPVIDNGFYLLKGAQGRSPVTIHAVGSAEALAKSRASIVVEVFRDPV